MDKTATASSPARVRAAAPPTRAHALAATVPRSLRRSWPVALIGVVLIALWYAVGLYDDLPAARQLLGDGASSGQVWNAALDLHNPWVPLPHQVLADFFGALASRPTRRPAYGYTWGRRAWKRCWGSLPGRSWAY